MQQRFSKKVALVTGGASGIGRAAVLAFAREGASVVVSDVDDAGGAETVREVETQGGRAVYVHCDVSVEPHVERLFSETMSRFGRLDCAFNNAGISGASATTGEYTFEQWSRVIGTNLTGVWLCMRRELELLSREGGAIVNNSSILGHVGFASAPAYVAAKHGVLGLTKNAALEYGARNVRVNAVCPAFIETPMLERAGLLSDAQQRSAVEALHPLGRLGRPREVADAVLWLCSQEASFVTGTSLLVDGGYVAR